MKFFSPVISSNIHYYFNNIFHKSNVLKKVITTEKFNKFIKFWMILFFQLSSYYQIYFLIYCHIYIYIYIYIYIMYMSCNVYLQIHDFLATKHLSNVA